MCVIDVMSTKTLAKTDVFAEHRMSGFFGSLKKRLRRMHFVFFEFSDGPSHDRQVIFTHESFSHMIFDSCNNAVLERALLANVWLRRIPFEHKNSNTTALSTDVLKILSTGVFQILSTDVSEPEFSLDDSSVNLRSWQPVEDTTKRLKPYRPTPYRTTIPFLLELLNMYSNDGLIRMKTVKVCYQ